MPYKKKHRNQTKKKPPKIHLTSSPLVSDADDSVFLGFPDIESQPSQEGNPLIDNAAESTIADSSVEEKVNSSVEPVQRNMTERSNSFEPRNPEWVFNGKNYREWKLRIENLFACDDSELEDLLQDGETNAKNEKAYLELAPDKRKSTMADFYKKQQKAKRIIYERIDNSYISRISECVTVKQIINLLDKEYRVNSRAGRISARKKWVNLRFGIGGDMRKYIILYEARVREYIEAGGDVTEEDKIEQLQASMPEAYECIADWFENLQPERQTYANYRQKLIDRYDRCHQSAKPPEVKKRAESPPQPDQEGSNSKEDKLSLIHISEPTRPY